MTQYYERVKIISCNDYPEYVGMVGYVQGLGKQDSGEITGCFVRFEDEDVESCTFEPHELEGTGELLTKEEFDERFMSGVTLRVSVDEDGNGKILPTR